MTFRFLFSLLLFLPGYLIGQNADVKGSFSLLPGREVRLISESDPISKASVVLDLDTIAQDGSFNLSANLDSYQSILLSVNRYTAPIFIGPGDQIEIQVADEQRFRLADSWLKGKLEYNFIQADTNKVNQQISKFDGAYYFFFLKNSTLVGTNAIKDQILEFQKDFENPEGANDFVKTYTRYSVAEMKLSNGFKKNDIYNEYLNEAEVSLTNPAWISFFNTFYADYFDQYDNRYGGATLYNRLNAGLSPDSLNLLLDKDDFLSRRDLRQLVLLKSIAENYTNPKFSKEPLEAILEDIQKKPETQEIKEVAENLQAKWNKDKNENYLKNIRDRYAQKLVVQNDSLYTLLITSLSGGPQLLKEIALIENLLGRYPNLFKVVELHLGPNFSSRSRAWPMVMVDKNYTYLSDFEIYSIPHFMWFDKKGKLEQNPATNPSQGLEELLFKLQSESDQENKIKVGQN